MRLIYDTEVDALTLELRREEVERTVDAGDGRFIDLDEGGGIVAIEILDASQGFTFVDLLERYDLQPVVDALADYIKTARQVLSEDSDMHELLVR